MPAEIEEVFASCGTPLFPRTARDLDMTCSCPDWEVPCKHLAAVCYVLAEAFDDDPFAMLAWRGKRREDLLASLRRLTGGRDTAMTRPVIDVADRPLSDWVTEQSFWGPSLSASRLRSLPPAVPAPPDLLLRSVDPPLLTAGGQDLPTLLRPAYQAMAESDGDGPDAA
jgi:uncharacterized Zn finger protein